MHKEGELVQDITCAKFAHMGKEGELEKESNVHFLHIANSDKPVQYYSLDVIISVGYRVKS